MPPRPASMASPARRASSSTARRSTRRCGRRSRLRCRPPGPADDKPRGAAPMQIKRLRLTGFKSFVDPADLRIEPGLTGIVGPNGCGKSNLLEALRWAMGENSAKSMRGAGMEDVIFAGTATRPARDFAEVSILAEQVGDDDELEVVRRIE